MLFRHLLDKQTGKLTSLLMAPFISMRIMKVLIAAWVYALSRVETGV
jgi:hypothetical protein